MAEIKPFKGIRPVADKVHLVASRSVDTYNTQSLKQKLAENPYSFLHVINPEHDDPNKTRPNTVERLLKVKAKFNTFCKEHILIHDEQECFYVYRQIKDDNTYTGIMGCSAVSDYLNGTIKIHEQTITEREQKLKNYLDVCEFNAEPVLFCYPNHPTIDMMVNETIETRPDYDFTTTDRVRHTLWVIRNIETNSIIKSSFEQVPAIYIADGHHRSASSALLAIDRQNKNGAGKDGPYNYFLGIYFAENQLKIYDFNRVVKDLNGLTTEQFLDKLRERFDVEVKGKDIYKPARLHNFSLYLDNTWYCLSAKPGTYKTGDPVESLDASILSHHILGPVLNITDLKTDKRIAFIPGVRGMEELKKQVDSGKMKAAFGLYPVLMSQLKNVADTGNIMPPKTTYIEPKLRSGLVIYSLHE
jgi:uncharacterized protein (DUF1015 family)